MEILLDTNFIIACAREKIDFDSLANEIVDEPITWIVPKEVFAELENIKDSQNQKVSDRNAAKLGIDLIKTLNPKIVELGGRNPNIDIRIVNYLKDAQIVLATLDKALKSRVNNRILTVRGKKKLEFI